MMQLPPLLRWWHRASQPPGRCRSAKFLEHNFAHSSDGPGRCGHTQARAAPAKLRDRLPRRVGHTDIINAMASRAREFRGDGCNALAALGRGEKFYAGPGGHHGFAMGVAGEGKGAVRECKNDSAVAH